jgi:Transposase DDE domain
MRPTHSTLDRPRLEALTRQRVLDHLGLRDFKRKATKEVLAVVLAAAAAGVTSISAACRRLRGAPSGHTVRTALHDQLPAAKALAGRLNAALADGLPRAVRMRPRDVAIDLTLDPYYGRPWRDDKEVYRGRHGAGTNRYHAYATACVVRHGLRFTLAVLPFERGTPRERVVRDLLRLVRALGVTVRRLLLDREFFSARMVRDLQAAGVPFLIPVAFRGKPPVGPPGPGSLRRFRAWTTSGWAEHWLTPHRGKRRVQAAICVCCRNYRGRWDKHGRVAMVYAAWGLGRPDPHWVFTAYRKRFGIESSYRQLHQAQAVTTSRSPRLRLLFVGLALLLRNLWVWVHWEVLSRPRRGGRAVCLDRLRFEDLLLWLLHGIEQHWGTVDQTITERKLKPSLVA